MHKIQILSFLPCNFRALLEKSYFREFEIFSLQTYNERLCYTFLYFCLSKISTQPY
ncbi:hypothetical protein HFN_1103 [Helicobacter fennelliae MRY12-0050]|uniref:Uncharacterized protein n=1 Tax=Helicobacter fennelliae MRY12-0050 TaxID=1325130 RepID=T1DWR5_9HELI|nr:hypothetical protein HFN_1103 [Helicobacter fennelliae MRY12-0050]